MHQALLSGKELAVGLSILIVPALDDNLLGSRLLRKIHHHGEIRTVIAPLRNSASGPVVILGEP